MKNKKISKILLALLITITSFFTTIGNALAEVPNRIDVTSTAATKGYIGDTVNFGTKSLSDGSVAYCLDYHKLTPDHAIGTLAGEMDAGMSYLIENGYPQKAITGNKAIDYYITQIAIWWYLDETTGSTNLNEAFKTTDSDPQNLRPTIKKLVEDAKAAKNKGYKNPKISATISNNHLAISQDKKYYISNEIKVTLTDLENYNVELIEAPQGSYIADAVGNKKTTFQPSETFRVYVPASEVKEKKSNIKVKITSKTVINKVYKYTPEHEVEQRILTAILYPTTVEKEETLNLMISPSKVTITKIDAETQKPLKGAVLVVKDKDGNIVAEFTTSEEAYVIQDLSNGEYEVSEKSAPEGYIVNEKTYKFTIDDDHKDHTITFENYKKVDVPDTNSNSTIMYILGTIIMASGISFVIYHAKKRQENK